MPSKNGSVSSDSDIIIAEPNNDLEVDNVDTNDLLNVGHNDMPSVMFSSGYYTQQNTTDTSNQNNCYSINDSVEEEQCGNSDNSGNSATYPLICRQKMQRKLKYYFMNPIEKFQAKKRFPLKLLIQIIKIILVTSQLVVFGDDMSRYITNAGNRVISFRELFLINWDPIREVTAYPPTAGPFAVYTKHDFYESVDYAIRQYSNITGLSIGAFGYAVNNTQPNQHNMSVGNITFCRKRYAEGVVDPSNYYYVYDNEIIDECIIIRESYEPGDQQWFTVYNTLNYLDSKNFSLNFDRLLNVRLILPLRTIYLNSLSKYDSPKCYDVKVTILYDNSQHNGQILVSLNAKQTRHKCNGNLKISDNSENKRITRQVLNWFVIVFCITSFILCMRSLINGYKLRKETELFFTKHFEIALTFQEKTDFIDLWYVMIVVNDMIIFAGTIIKMQMEFDAIENSYYNTCSILLGFGILLVWAGVLRYLGFFDKYNILIITLRRAIPHVLRFMLCTIILYGGFLLMGWVVLGPYHLKFRTISRTSECLFAMMNGDDMFATFYITESGEHVVIWWFSRFYFYSFVCLFIYVVLSLFIAIIMDSYETIKEFYQNGIPDTNLQKFIGQCTDDSTSKAYMEDRNRSVADIFHLCLNCFRRTSQSLRTSYNLHSL